MTRQNLVAKAARKFKTTTDSNHPLPVAPNLLEQNFYATGPNQKWGGYITYLMTSEGWLYLAVIIDLYSRTVIGWSMSNRMTAQLACDALTMDREIMKQTVFEYIEVDYNKTRRHSSLDYLSPENFGLKNSA